MSAVLIDQPEHLTTDDWFDLGDGYRYKFLTWNPDFSIASNAAKWAHLAHLIKRHPVVGATISHRCRTESGVHEGAIYFRTVLTKAVPSFDKCWDVQSWAPLHISPSLLSHCPCNSHGFIRGGRWVKA